MTFNEYFGREKEFSIDAPGRVEIGGNHTDHQGGCVFAGAINLKCRADVAKRSDGIVRVYSEGFGECIVNLDNLEYIKTEEGSTVALIKGLAKKFDELNSEKLFGFDAYVTSDVAVGSGLSSSAAFEVLIGRIFNKLGGFNVSDEGIAQFSQYAENVYYGKPCGLMDQMASSVGGLSFMDFRNADNPKLERISLDLKSYEYALCVIDTGSGHEDLTFEYAAIPSEMKALAAYFGEDVLSRVSKDEFYAQLGKLRKKFSDRAVLRGMHFFEETERARAEFDALKVNDFDKFLQLVRASGKSSFEYLQNVIPSGYIKHQDMAFTLCLCEKLLDGDGAVRVHGGGFGGSVLAFVPLNKLATFKEKIENILKPDCVHVLEFE